MTIAQNFKDSGIPFAEILEQADKIAVDAYQEWEMQETTFKFADGSELKAKYPDILHVL